jgi:DNA-binding PadR family transcriptional regulator
MTHASRILDQLKEGRDDPDVPDEQREQLNERIQELTTGMYDLTGFQRDQLRAIAALTTDQRGPKGLEVLEWLEDEAGYDEVHHGRLYPNMNTLSDMGLVSKAELDRRSNEYRLTQRGRREIQEHLNEWADAVDGLDGVATDGGDRGLDALFPGSGGDA